MPSSILAIRVDSELSDEAARIEHYGLYLSSAIRAFLTHIVNTNSTPLSFDYGHPSDKSLVEIRETGQMIATGDGKTCVTSQDPLEAGLP